MEMKGEEHEVGLCW